MYKPYNNYQIKKKFSGGGENGDGTSHKWKHTRFSLLRFIKAEVRKGEQSPTLGSLYNPLSYHDPLHHLI